MRLNRDVIVALLLLVLCGTFFAASFAIRKTSYGTIGSELWPRAVLVFLALASGLYLAQSLRLPRAERAPDGPGFFAEYRNAIWCFSAFALFLVVLPVLGMLIAGILFVFVLLTLLGGWERRAVVVHGAISVGAVGAMWLIFTFGLHVMLPEGMIFRFN